jgi:hypothetical protein
MSTTRAGAASNRRLAAGVTSGRSGERTALVPAGGSVSRCAANHSVPPRQSRAATPTPAAGYTSVASSVTAAGPITKHSSSATDSKEYAVCSRGEPASSTLHRARTIEPSDGMVPPATAPGTNSAQLGACSSTAAMSPATLSAKMATSGISTRCWPRESASRANCGAQTAMASDPDADTLPAIPYRPVLAEISSTVPRPDIAIGIRPMTPAIENRHARGTRKISAYGTRNPGTDERYRAGQWVHRGRSRQAGPFTGYRRGLVGWKHVGLRCVSAAVVRRP